MGDIDSRPQVLLNGEVPSEPALSKHEEDALVRESTAAMPDWTAKFFRQLLNFFENLPEPGKNNRAGGKVEEQLIAMCVTCVEYLCTAMSEELFDTNLKRLFDYAASTVRTNTVKSVGALVGCFTRSNATKTFDLFFPLCARNIRAELAGGASSVRTTSTSNPESGDLVLHWYCSLLIGACSHVGESVRSTVET